MDANVMPSAISLVGDFMRVGLLLVNVGSNRAKDSLTGDRERKVKTRTRVVNEGNSAQI